jgi:hypothetical protein
LVVVVDGVADVAEVDRTGELLVAALSVRPGMGVISVNCLVLGADVLFAAGAEDVQPANAIAALTTAAATAYGVEV